MTILSIATVSSYSFIGDGIESNPYLIHNCSELDEIKNNDTSAYYRLNNDIDCDSRANNIQFVINNFNGTFDGGNNTISNLYSYGYLSKIGVGFIRTANNDVTIKNVVFDNFEIYGGETGAVYDCGLVGQVSVGSNLNISKVGFINSRHKCSRASAFGFGRAYGNNNISITDFYVLNSSRGNIIGSLQKGSVFGYNLLSTTTLDLNNIIISTDLDSGFDPSYLNAISWDGNYVGESNNIVWDNETVNQSYNLNPSSTYEINRTDLFNPSATAWENFSEDVWVFSTTELPSFKWAEEIVYQNFTDIFTYAPAPECNSSNYQYSAFAEWGYDTGVNHIQCMSFEGGVTLFPDWNESEDFIFCVNVSSGLFKSFNSIITEPPFTPSSLSDRTYPYNYQWTNFPDVDTADVTDKTISIITDNGWYFRYDITSIYDATSDGYNFSANWVKRCDGSMYVWSDPRCSANYSIFNNDTPVQNFCHFWFNEEESMTEDRNFTDTNTWFVGENHTLDCNGHSIYMENAQFGDDSDNITNFLMTDCYFNNIDSSYSGFKFQTWNQRDKPLVMTLDNINVDDPNGYNFFYVYEFNAEANITIRDSANLNSIFFDGAIQNMYLINNTDTYSNTAFSVQVNGNDDEYLLMRDNDFTKYGNLVYSYDGFTDVDIYKNNMVGGVYDGGQNILRSKVNMTYNNFIGNIGNHFVVRGYYDSMIAYNNFSAYDPDIWGDNDGDPAVYDAVSYNAYTVVDFRHSDNLTIEHNNFHNISGLVRLYIGTNNSVVRYNDFLNAGALNIISNSHYNEVYDNDFHCDNVTFGYGGFGIYAQADATNNHIHDNNVTGYQGTAIYDRDSGYNLWENNFINLTMASPYREYLNDWWFGNHRAISIRGYTQYSTFIGNTVYMDTNATLRIENTASNNNITQNDFYYTPVLNINNNDYYCNTYNDGAYLDGATDSCPTFQQNPLVCNGVEDASVDVNDTYNWSVQCTDDDTIKNFTIECDLFTFVNTTVDSTSYNYSNTTIVASDIFCNYTICDDNLFNPECSFFSQVIVANPPYIPTGSLQVGECPSDLAGNVTLFGIIFIGLVLVGIGAIARSAFFGIFGCLVLLFGATYLSGCSGVIGYIVGAMGLVGVIWFAVRK